MLHNRKKKKKKKQEKLLFSWFCLPQVNKSHMFFDLKVVSISPFTWQKQHLFKMAVPSQTLWKQDHKKQAHSIGITSIAALYLCK